MGLTHFLLIFYRAGFSFVRNWHHIVAISGATAATKQGMSSVVFLKSWNASLSCIFI